MTRVLAQKKSKKQKSSIVSRLAQKAEPKAAPKPNGKKLASKAKLSSPKGRKSETRNTHKKTLRPNRPVPRERSKMEVESGKQASRAVSAPPVNVPARLLHLTKTTSAALLLLGKGVELIFQKDFKKAKNELKSLLQMYPGELDILARARSYIQICEREEANLKKPAASADQLYARGIL